MMRIKNNMYNNKAAIIGVSGPSGSGKSTLCHRLMKDLCGCGYIHLDKFYKKDMPKIISSIDGKEYDDWNHPSSIDLSSALNAVEKALEYDNRYIFVDGAFLLCIEELRKMCDMKIFVDATIETRFYRRIKRNLSYGYTLESIAEYYLGCARHREAEYAVPSKKYSDIVVDNETDFEKNIPEIIGKIKAFDP